MAIMTEIEASDDIEFLRETCIHRGNVIKELKNKIQVLLDELKRTQEDLDSCYKSNY